MDEKYPMLEMDILMYRQTKDRLQTCIDYLVKKYKISNEIQIEAELGFLRYEQ